MQLPPLTNTKRCNGIGPQRCNHPVLLCNKAGLKLKWPAETSTDGYQANDRALRRTLHALLAYCMNMIWNAVPVQIHMEAT